MADKWDDLDYLQFVFDISSVINLFQRPVDVITLVTAMRALRQTSFIEGVTPNQMMRAWNEFADAAGPAMVAQIIEDGHLQTLMNPRVAVNPE